MRIIQNGYNQKRNAYDQTEFFICTHNYHPPSTGFSEWVEARPPATLVNTLFSFPPCPLWSRGGYTSSMTARFGMKHIVSYIRF